MDTLAHVEFEVVLLGYVFNQVEGLLHCVWVVAYQDGVICVGQVKEWCVLAVKGGQMCVGRVQCLLHIMHDGTVDDQKKVRGKWASLSYACGGSVGGAVDASCLDLEEWVFVDVGDECDELWLHSISLERGEECLWVDFVKCLLPVQEKHVKWAVCGFCLFHDASDDMNGLGA